MHLETRTIRTLLLLLLAASPGLADRMDWQSPSPQSNIWQGFYTSPYLAWDRDMNPPAAGTLLTIYCLDYNHEVAPPYSWEADIRPLSIAYANDYQYAGAFPTAQQEYLQYVAAAWLFTAMRGLSPALPNLHTVENEYQVAAWKLFVDQAHKSDLNSRIQASGTAFATAVNTYYAQALAAAPTWTPVGWHVVTADPDWVNKCEHGRPVQEFLTWETQEPGAWATMAAVLGATYWIRRRHRRGGNCR